MKHSVRLGLIVLFLLSPLVLHAQDFIAVLRLDGKGLSEVEASILTDRLRSELFQTGKFDVVEREKMNDILREQNFQLVGCTSDECLVKVGELIGVSEMVGGSVSKFGSMYSISIRLISVESGKILQTAVFDHKGAIEGLLETGIRQVAGQLAFGGENPAGGQTAVSAASREPLVTGRQISREPPAPDIKKQYTESWYTYWAVGSAGTAYPDQLQQLLDWADSQPGVSRSRFTLDLFGFYWHLAPRTIFGFIINGANDRFNYQEQSISINQYLYSLSTIHFTGRRFGKGLFLRGDLGVASIGVEDPAGEQTRSKAGGGVLLGTGWAIDFGGTRLLLGANLAVRRVEQASYSVVNFSLGGLF